ncbi:helix-turn-helix domain-containing protein [Rhodospirillales bacterium]|nr:helix-turn-helix domain-containing protein [Rhodospirillales bacterium]
MTPFGKKVREHRRAKGLTLKQMAADLGVSAAYFSALEHGHRGRPSSGLVSQIAGYFTLMWDEAEEIKELAALSHPKITVNTAGLNPKATELANLLAENIEQMDVETLDWVIAEVRMRIGSTPDGPTH